jgi:hypothetical protein
LEGLPVRALARDDRKARHPVPAAEAVAGVLVGEPVVLRMVR